MMMNPVVESCLKINGLTGKTPENGGPLEIPEIPDLESIIFKVPVVSFRGSSP